MAKVGLFYGSTTGETTDAVEKAQVTSVGRPEMAMSGIFNLGPFKFLHYAHEPTASYICLSG
ncbi:MAG: hypothetical protein AAGD25_16940 [Cyanobacteria bacterium P01_F01_bin.150]